MLLLLLLLLLLLPLLLPLPLLLLPLLPLLLLLLLPALSVGIEASSALTECCRSTICCTRPRRDTPQGTVSQAGLAAGNRDVSGSAANCARHVSAEELLGHARLFLLLPGVELFIPSATCAQSTLPALAELFCSTRCRSRTCSGSASEDKKEKRCGDGAGRGAGSATG